MEKLVSPGPPGSAAVHAEMQDWYFADNNRQRGSVCAGEDMARNNRDIDRLGKPRLPPMPPDDCRAHGQRHRAQSEGGPRIRHSDRSAVLSGMAIAPVAGHNMESAPSLGARVSPKQAQLQAVTVSTPPASDGASPSRSGHVPLQPAADPAAQAAAQPAPVAAPELNSAGAIQDWLAQAQQRLVGLVPGVTPAENANTPADEGPKSSAERNEEDAAREEEQVREDPKMPEMPEKRSEDDAAREGGEPARAATPCSASKTPNANGGLRPADCAGGSTRTSSSSRSRTPESRSHSFREASPQHNSRRSATPGHGSQSPLEAANKSVSGEAKEAEATAATAKLEEDHAEKAPLASQEASPAASARRSSLDDTTTVRTPNSNRSRSPDSRSRSSSSSSRGSSRHSSRSSATPRRATQSVSEAKEAVGAATLCLAEVPVGTGLADSKAESPVVSARRRSNGLRGTATLRSSMGLTAGSYADDFEEFAPEGDDGEGESEEEDGEEDDESEAASLEGTH